MQFHRYRNPPQSLFTENRSNFISKMKPGHFAVFFSNEVINLNGDGNYPFVQNSNFYYLTGIDQEECILLLFPDAPKPEWKEILFIRETNAVIQVWEGWKYSKSEASEASGIHNIKFFPEFRQTLKSLISQSEGVYVDVNEHERNSIFTSSSAHAFANRFREEFPAHKIERAYPILERQRSFKSSYELEQLKEAIRITESGFRRLLPFLKPGIKEFELEAELIHEFVRQGSRGFAYEPIIAIGKNACVLHYNLNKDECKDGEVILLDVAAEYGHYSADLTRCLPVNGSFTRRQKAVYNAVYSVFIQAREMLIPGEYLEVYHQKVGKIMEVELLNLGLITQDEINAQDPSWPAYKKYFMHGTSHFLGLDTHDVGNRYNKFEAGMVFTCEPGIYIPEEGIGIRLENNILITDQAPLDLMSEIPILADEIENLMQ